MATLMNHATAHQSTRRGPHAPACDHNKYPIHDVLKTVITSPQHAQQLANKKSQADDAPSQRSRCRVLELGAGTAEHAIYFTDVFSFDEIALWQATDLADELPGMRLNLSDAGVSSERCPSPLPLSFTDNEETWRRLNCSSKVEVNDDATVVTTSSDGGASFDIVFTANTFHIAPWEACLTCCARLELVVAPGGYFVMYGPFNYNGTHTSESNARFDAWLKVNKSPQSAIRHFELVRDALGSGGFDLYADHAMPENNHCLVFQKRR